MILYYTLSGYLNFLFSLGYIAKGYCIAVIITFSLLILSDYFGFSGKILRGSRRTINFFKEKGWVDNSNISAFLIRCVRHFPYILRANFSIFTNSNKPLTDYINDRCYSRRDHYTRERVIRYIFDFVMVSGAIITFINVMDYYGVFYAVKFLITVLIFIVLRYILIGNLMVREIVGKKRYLKALDLMANGIFLNNSNSRPNLDLENKYSDGSVSINEDGVIIERNTPEICDVKIDKTH